MNVTLPENKIDKKSIIVYSLIIGICIISIILVVYLQFFEGRIVSTVGNLKGKSDQNYEQLKSEFNLLFDNKLQVNDEAYENIKEDPSKDLVYTAYINNENKEDVYNLSVNIPYINIDNSEIKQVNDEIINTFQTKAEDILKTTNQLSLYSVEYTCDIQDGILSLVIYSNLKEGSNAQRVIIKTYNYSLKEKKIVDLKYVLNMENVEESHAQNRIDKEIEIAHKNAEDLKSMGKHIYERDLKDKIYKVENISEFYFHDGSIYIIFAYGNEKYTSEYDLVII
ncbi:MAG: hypothetical protein IKF97_07170 [Clostridia bacterium]|nr:hypothetical protein [Clostridia bacterium]